jgi:predicted dehydrogenase
MRKLFGGPTSRRSPFGSAATLSVSSRDSDTALLPDDGVRRDLSGLRTCTVDLPPAPTDMFADFVASCLERRAPVMSGDAALGVMQIVRLAYLSAAAGREATFAELRAPGIPQLDLARVSMGANPG